MAAGRPVPPVKSLGKFVSSGSFETALPSVICGLLLRLSIFAFVLAEKGGLHNQVMLGYKILPESEALGMTIFICELYLQLILFPALP